MPEGRPTTRQMSVDSPRTLHAMNERRPAVGDLSPDVEFLDSAGRPWRLTAHRGSVVVLVFHRHIH